MTIYFSEQPLHDEVITTLRKNYPRGEMSSNSLSISRADNIDYNLLLDYFDCAVSKVHSLFSAAITLPEDFESRIPFWVVRGNGEVWVEPNSGPKGRNVLGESLFVLRFNLYVEEDKINTFPSAKPMSTEDALVAEFISIRHALIEGNEEPIEVLKSFYGNMPKKEPKSYIARYLAHILSEPHP